MFEFNATIIVAMISFAVFILIMNAILYRPILGIINKRNDFVDNNYETAKELANKAQNLKVEYHQKLEDAKEHNRKILANDIENTQKISLDKIQKAKEQAKIQIQNNKEIIEAEKNKLYETINSGLIDELSSEIIKKIVG